MKYLVLVGDGMADYPLEELGGKTCLEAAATPAMDELAMGGIVGLYCPIPEGFAPGSDIGNLSLFGYDPAASFTGRAPLEAARQGISLSGDQVAFRCNLVTLENGAMRSFTSGHIPTEDAREIIRALNAELGSEGVAFHSGVSYRHLAVLRETPGAAFSEAVCTPPHDISDKEYGPHLPSGPGAEYLRGLMERSQAIIEASPASERRLAEGHLAPTSIWLWGQGKAPQLDPYRSKFGLTGAVVSAVDLVKGIGVCAGLEILEVEGATGYLDTNYEGKVAAALNALERVDIAFIHIEAPDETGHEGRADLKVKAIEDFDRRVVGPCLEHAKSRGSFRILAAPDHVTAISTKTHAGGPVPFVLWGVGIAPDGSRAYSEETGKESGLLLEDGHELLPLMMSRPFGS